MIHRTDFAHLKLRRVGNEAHPSYSPEWADEHPRTAYLLREEADLWARQGMLLLKLG